LRLETRISHLATRNYFQGKYSAFMDWPYFILMSVTIILFIIGLAGTVIPILPGVPIIWLGTVIFAVFTNFEKVGYWVIAFFTLLALFSIAIDYVANLYGAKKFGAGKWGVIGAFVGMVVGIITAGFIGLIIGPLIGAFVGELISGKEGAKAFKAGIGALVGFLGGVLVKLVIGLIMIGVFVWRVL